jgi:hypothetical protein
MRFIFRKDFLDKQYDNIKLLFDNNNKISPTIFNNELHTDLIYNIKFNENVMKSNFEHNTLLLLEDKGFILNKRYNGKYKDETDFNNENLKLKLIEFKEDTEEGFDKFIIENRNDDITKLNAENKQFDNIKKIITTLSLTLSIIYYLSLNDKDFYKFVRNCILSQNDAKKHFMIIDFMKTNETLKAEDDFNKKIELDYLYSKDTKHNIIYIKELLLNYMNELFKNNEIMTLEYDEKNKYINDKITLKDDEFKFLTKDIRTKKTKPINKKELMDIIYFVLYSVLGNVIVRNRKQIRIKKIRSWIFNININEINLKNHLKLLVYRIEKGDTLKDKQYYKFTEHIKQKLKEIQIDNIDLLYENKSNKIKELEKDYEPDYKLRCKECGLNINICNEIHNENENISLSIQGDTNNINVCFQILDIKGFDDFKINKGYCILIFGKTENGNDILCKVKGFKPYFYIENTNDITIDDFKKILNLTDYNNIDIIQEKHFNFRGFNNNKTNNYFKLSFNYIKDYHNVITFINDNNKEQFKLFNGKIEPIIQFIHYKNINPSSWIKILSNNQYLELNEIEPININKLAPFKVTAFDIECYSESRLFPKSIKDPIIQIGLTTHKLGNINDIEKTIITLNTCDDIEGVNVIICQTERELLYTFKEELIKLNPDIITGYNIYGFDIKYIMDRCNENNIKDFCDGLGKTNIMKSSIKSLDHHSKTLINYNDKTKINSFLNQDKYKFDFVGSICIDMIKYIKDNKKLDSYTLNDVSKIILNDTKDDLTPNELFKKYEGNATDRAIIAKYCIQDCILINKIFDKEKVYENNSAISNVCKVPFIYIYERGQSIKALSLVI